MKRTTPAWGRTMAWTVLLLGSAPGALFGQGDPPSIHASAGLATPPPREVTIDCQAGRTVTAVLQFLPARAPLDIVVRGRCTESVVLERDDVTLRAASPGDGFDAPSPDDVVLTVRGGRRIVLEGLTLHGGQRGLDARGGAHFVARGLTVEGAAFAGVHVSSGAAGELHESEVRGNGSFGVSVELQGALVIAESRIEDNDWGVMATANGAIELRRSSIRHHRGIGLFADLGGSVGARASVVEDCDTGIQINEGGSLRFDGGFIRANRRLGVALHGASASFVGGASITDNEGIGVGLFNSSRAAFQDTSVQATTGEPGWGILLVGGSTVRPQGLVVTDNAGDGINLHDTSVAELDDTLQVVGNGGWGIFCADAPAVAQLHGTPGEVSDNTAGQIHCPGFPEP